MFGNNRGLILAALVVLSTLAGGLAAVGSAAAQETETPSPTATPTDDGPISEKTLSVDNDTRAVEALAENATGTLDVTVYGVDADGSETEVATGTLDATGNTTDSYQYTELDTSTYPEYRVEVDGDASAGTISISKVQVVSGGGGFIGNGSELPLLPIVIVAGVVLALVAAAAIWGRR